MRFVEIKQRMPITAKKYLLIGLVSLLLYKSIQRIIIVQERQGQTLPVELPEKHRQTLPIGTADMPIPDRIPPRKTNSLTLPKHLANVDQEDPNLIDYLRKEVIDPPSPKKYNLEKSEATHFSQLGQSMYADSRFLNGMKNGFFVEAGAANGEYISNTLYFERELGWRGLLIEPFSDAYQELRSKNRKAFTVNSALSDFNTTTEVIFESRGKKGVLSKLIRDDKKGLKIMAIPLYSILKALEVDIVDFLSLDIESHEVKVIKTLPFDKIKFRLMCIEVNHIPERHTHLTKYLRGKGYVFLGLKIIDAWYGHPDLLNKTIIEEALKNNP